MLWSSRYLLLFVVLKISADICCAKDVCSKDRKYLVKQDVLCARNVMVQQRYAVSFVLEMLWSSKDMLCYRCVDLLC